jgi:outer membrane receptor for ferrienterochelin and colicin
MTCKILKFLLLAMIPASLFSQGTVEGIVKDALTGETLIGVNIVYGEGKGTVSDIDGHYTISLPAGSYNITASYVGYEPQTKKINIANVDVILDFDMKTIMLSEVEVVADMARARETPVAFSTIKPLKLEEELASQDIPMILNTTPGVYATQQGGGDGDARINIRGFSQRNVAVMIDGIPVNDMENGWVYWSNWFGLDLVTQSIQVQRGLGASKLALPSIGGTMNIITAGIQQKRQIKVKQEVANDGYFRTSASYNSGQLLHGWGITAAGSYKRGDGWVDQTYTKGWFYYLKVDKKLGNHILSLSAMGAPQEHGQRRYQKPLATYDSDYAAEHGVDANPSQYFATTYIDTSYMFNKGTRYNPDWGKYVDKDGKEIYLNEKVNYYHKPQFTLRDFWNISEKFYLSNILYLSLGNGGGTSLKRSVRADQGYITPEGQIDMQRYYDINIANVDPLFPDELKSYQFLRSQINNHQWYGLLSTFNYTISDALTFSGGLDLRRYTGEHYEELYNLIGGDYILDASNANRNPNEQLRVGDKLNYHNDGIVQWGGFFTQLEYKSGNLSAFVNLTGAYSGYKKIDYFLPKVLDVDDTTLYIEWGKPVDYNGVTYDENSPGIKYQESDWYWKPGFTFKAGANYNLSERSNIFLNTGYLSKAPRFNNVYERYRVVLLTDIENEKIAAVEVGYTFSSKIFALNANAYFTDWKNAPGFPVSYPINEDEIGYGNIQGMDARHMGIEVDFAYNILKNLEAEGLLSLGDWRWTSEDTVTLYDQNNRPVQKEYFNAEGVHVGDAAQTQLAASLRWEIIKYLYIKGQITYFDRYFAEFNPFDLNPSKYPGNFDENGKPLDTWQMPSYYLIDMHAGYSFKWSKVRLDVRASVLNLLNTTYISDASNNDSFSATTIDNDAKSAGVFYGMGRRFNTSLTISF